MNEAINFFDAKHWSFWHLSQNGKRLDKHEGEDFPESREKLMETLDLLMPGTYTLKVWEKKSGEAAEKVLNFRKKDVSHAQVAANNRTMNQTPQEYQDALDKARQQGFEAGHQKASLESQIERLKERADKTDVQIQEILKAVKDLSDGDPENDDNAFEKVTDMITKAPQLLKGIRAMTGKE